MALISKRTGAIIAVVAVVGIAAIAYFNRPNSATVAVGQPASLVGRIGAIEAELAVANTKSILKPAMDEAVRRDNETRAVVKTQGEEAKALGVRVKAIEDEPKFDPKKFEEEQKKKSDEFIKSLPPAIPLSQYRALEKRVADMEEEAKKAEVNFPLRSVA